MANAPITNLFAELNGRTFSDSNAFVLELHKVFRRHQRHFTKGFDYRDAIEAGNAHGYVKMVKPTKGNAFLSVSTTGQHAEQLSVEA